MNKLLTKEQWYNISSILRELEHSNDLNKDNILNVLSKHVEKDLDFEMKVIDCDDGTVSVQYDKSDNSVNISFIEMADDACCCRPESSLWFSDKEFLRLYEGLEKIKEVAKDL